VPSWTPFFLWAPLLVVVLRIPRKHLFWYKPQMASPPEEPRSLPVAAKHRIQHLPITTKSGGARPCNDDRKWLRDCDILEGAQAGLSWDTVLRKRHALSRSDGWRRCAEGRAATDAKKVKQLLSRSRASSAIALKIAAHPSATAQAFLQVQQEFGSFDIYIWRFMDGKPKQTPGSANFLRARKPRHPEQRLAKRGFRS